MDEFIREVDEEYRRERMAAIWRRYGGVFVALAVLLVASVGGWRYWQHVERQRGEAAAMRLEDAVQLAREQKSTEAEAALQALANDGAGPDIGLLARFRLAAELGLSDAEAGAKAFDAIAAEGTTEASLRDLARFRAASLRVSAEASPDATRELERLASPTSPWRHSARETLGLAALKRGDFEGAGKWFDQIVADRDTPQNLRGRLEIYTALVAGGPVQTTTQ